MFAQRPLLALCVLGPLEINIYNFRNACKGQDVMRFVLASHESAKDNKVFLLLDAQVVGTIRSNHRLAVHQVHANPLGCVQTL